VELPVLIFLDLNMPLKNGFDCLKEIKKDDKLKSLPVIIYSTSGEEEVIKLVYKAGALFYIQKPDNFSN
jgi:DNA-binding response OmpR family regulator